jgi:hypothetical protein
VRDDDLARARRALDFALVRHVRNGTVGGG